MGNRIVTAVKQRFSIRKLSIGAASVLLGTSLYFMGAGAPVVHAATGGESVAVPSKVVSSTENDADVNNAIDKYAESVAQDVNTKLENDPKTKDEKVIIRPSDKQPVTVDTLGERKGQVGKIKDKIDAAKDKAAKDKAAIENYENKHNNPQILHGKESEAFTDQGLSIDDEKDSKINQISVDHKDISLKDITLPKDKDQSKKFDGIDGINVTYTNKMTNKEKKSMEINSDNKVIVDFQHDQCQGKEITVTYDNLENSYYLENIDNKTNRIKISKIERTFSDIRPGNTIFTSNGSAPTSDGLYDECHGPQLIIYNDPSDGFFYNNIKQVSVKDIYYDDKGKEIKFKDGDKNEAWIFVTSLNSDGHKRWDNKTYIEKVKAEIKAENSDPTPADIEKLDGSTVTGHHDGWWYSDEDNGSYNGGSYKDLAWDNNSEDNRYAFVGAVAIKYQPGLTITYGSDDNAWDSHWVCTQTQPVSTLKERVIIYDHIKDGTENVTGNDDVNMTVHYVMDDDSKAPSDSKQTVNFTETGVKDKVTGKIVWTPADSQTLNDVTSPVLTGYTADIKTAKGKAVNFGDPDINVTVHYSANAQTAKITYIDDTTKNNLDSKDASGKFGQAITFKTAPTDEIENYKKQGYVLVSNTFNDNKYQADDSKNVFYVHLKHGTKNVRRNDDVKMTIHYVMDDNSEAPSDNKQTLNFIENGIQDLVTKHIDWTPAVSQTLKDVDSPVLTGYTADIKTANGKVVNFGDDDVEVTVHYSANTQTATITYIDDTEKKTLSSANQNGKFNQVITFEHDPTEVIKGLDEKGYKLVSNDFNGNKYQADNNNNVFYVHFVHGTKDVSRSDDVNMTVHYVMDDNSEAPSDNKQTLSFTENGIQDLVTKHIDWTTANSQTFKDVVTPKVAGYTPDQDKVTGPIVNFGDKDIEATVRYSPNVQLGHINYIDDNTGKTLTRDDFSGRTNEHEDYTSTDRIQEFENKGYELVSNDYPEGGFNFDNNDRQDQVFNVHFKHGIVTVTTKNPQIPNMPIDPDSHSPKYPEDISDTNHDVKRTIDYKFKDGKIAQPTVNDSLHFERTVVIDKVTGDVLSDTWTPSQDFNDVQTPSIQGYTPDKAVVSDKNIGHDHQDIVEHVVYSPDAQHMTITYIDDTTRETLKQDKLDGTSDKDAKYTTGDIIKQYEEKHYKLVSDSTNGKDLIFDHDDNANQTYAVHFVHNTHAINQTASPKQTVHYVYADGLMRQGKAADDNVQQLSFKRDGYNDEVTGTDHWNAWTPANGNYNAVDSPVIQGYTPDKSVIEKSTVNPTDKDTEITVTYNANKQTAKITYIDDTTNTKLDSKDASGKFGQTITFETVPANEIENYKKKGYVFVSNNFDNQTYQAVDSDNVFEVHLKHGNVTVTTKKPQTPDTPIDPDPQSPKYPKDINNTNKDVKRTIDYKFKDGKTVQPTVNDTLHFERTVVIDKVTGAVSSDTWTQSQDFNDIQTPAIQGYTPDKTVVSDKNIDHDHQDIVEHVVYSPDVQHMTITYIDDTTGETLHTDNPNGVSNQDTNYTTGNTIKQYEEKHYKMVSDSTNGKDLIFDHDDNADQTYEVHFIHNTHAINQATSPKQTIHYVYADGLTRQGKVADDNVQQLSFARDGYNDEVTGLDHWNAWTPANSNYNAVDSPVIQGYTPDKSVIEKSTVNPTDKDTEITVVYNANKQAARVIYVDKTTNTTLTSDNLSGKSDKDSEYNTGDKIGQYKSQHYVLFEDETNGKNVVFDHDDQQDQTYYVYFVHDTQKVNRQDTVTSTINYKFEDGKIAQPTVIQTKQFSEDGIKDLVTGEITWDEATPQKFEDVVTKPIVGYTPDKDNVVGQTVKFGDQDIIEHIVYHNNMQKAVITYVDDVTNQTLASDSHDGKFDYEIKFNNNPSDVISGFEKSGYKLVSSNFKDGTKYKADNKQNEFIVHLTHNMQSVSRQDKVTETIHYVYEDGSKSQPDHEQTISFNETGTKDLVTGKITWNEAKPQKLEDVVIPKITGYAPDTDNVVGSTVKFGDDDVEVTVHYTANAQTAMITYIDDTEKKILNSDQQNSKFNQVITFEHDPAAVIKGLEEKGYQLVSDNFKPGIKYQADNKSNSFEVHLKHKTESVTRSGAVIRTIHYLYDDNTAKPDKIQTVSFNETGTKDYVTGKIMWDNDNAQTVDSVITPSITGYTPDKDKVAGQTFKFGDKDAEVTVRYNANAQTAKITYIDDTEKKTLGSDKQDGKFDHEIKFDHDPVEVIKGLKEKGYELVSDNFKPGIKYQNDNKSNSFEVHLVHTYEPAETSQTITETVHYIDANGKPVAPDHVATVVVKVTGTRDKVTNTTTWNTPGTGHFDKVLSPVVPNMTPDKKVIPGRDVRYGDSDITESVVYTLDEMPGESGKPNKPGDSTPKTPGKTNKPGDSTPKTPVKSNKPGDSTPKTPGKSNKPGNSTPKTPGKTNKPGDLTSKTPRKPNKLSNEVSKQRGTHAETTIPEKHVDSRIADNQASANSTAKQELPQTGATINTGIWVGLASMIASLGLLGASKKRKKN